MTNSTNIAGMLTPGKYKMDSGNAVSDALRAARASDVSYHHGAIKAAVGGRTDHLPMKVLEGSYVIPADIVSARGEGNTEAGFKIYNKMFKDGAYAKNISNSPYENGKLVPIIAAGGEYVIHPAVVAAIGDGDLKEGQNALDEFVLHERKTLIKTLRKLAPPKKN